MDFFSSFVLACMIYTLSLEVGYLGIWVSLQYYNRETQGDSVVRCAYCCSTYTSVTVLISNNGQKHVPEFSGRIHKVHLSSVQNPHGSTEYDKIESTLNVFLKVVGLETLSRHARKFPFTPWVILSNCCEIIRKPKIPTSTFSYFRKCGDSMIWNMMFQSVILLHNHVMDFHATQ